MGHTRANLYFNTRRIPSVTTYRPTVSRTKEVNQSKYNPLTDWRMTILEDVDAVAAAGTASSSNPTAARA